MLKHRACVVPVAPTGVRNSSHKGGLYVYNKYVLEVFVEPRVPSRLRFCVSP